REHRETVQVRAPHWVRSSIPEDVNAARLRRLLAGDSLPGSVPLAAAAMAGVPGSVTARRLGLHLALPPAPVTDDETPGPVRVAFASLLADGTTEVHRQVLSGTALAQWGRTHDLTVPLPAGLRRFAVIVEDLPSESWGSALVVPPSGDGMGGGCGR
nr:hypothetical protein [Acidobacteriota bacterium]